MTRPAPTHWPPHVEALADQLHALLCREPSDPSGDPRHRELDRGRARFLLVGLADTGYTLTRTAPATSDCH